jgi:hypothetical protein
MPGPCTTGTIDDRPATTVYALAPPAPRERRRAYDIYRPSSRHDALSLYYERILNRKQVDAAAESRTSLQAGPGATFMRLV